MWFFKKRIKNKESTESKKAIKTKNYTHTLESFDIGKTYLRATFTDKEEFDFCLYGDFYQCLNWGDQFTLLNVYPVSITTSLICAQQYISSVNEGYVTIVNDPKNPTVARFGKIMKIKIISTEKFHEDHAVHHLLGDPV